MQKHTKQLIKKAGIKAYLLYNATTDNIIYEHNANKRFPMASLTKLITALTVRACVSDPDHVFFAPEEDCADYVEYFDASVAGFVSFPGQQFSVTEYLYGLLLSSGCDAAYTLEKNLGNGDRTVFVEKMNAMAESLGCRKTHLTDASGFGDKKEHYTTANDICRILCDVMKDPLLYKILLTARHITVSERPWIMETTNLLNRYWADTFFSYSLGGKTGSTFPAGRCYCNILERNGQQYVFVEFGADFDLTEEQRYWFAKDIIREIFCDFFKETGPFMRVCFSDHYASVPVGTIIRPEVETLFNNTSEAPILQFSSNDPEIASVDAQGVITVCGQGVARIQVTTQTGDYDMFYVNSTGSEFAELRR